MLRELHVRNLAVLEHGALELGPGLDVLSGETGAGKSIVVDSLALLAGVRASAELIRSGAETLSVTGIFAPGGEAWRGILAAAGIEVGGEELVVRREISRSGRNRVYVDDRPVTLALLADLAPQLLRIHGQRDELQLVAPELQRTWLDRCGGASGQRLLAKAAKAFEAYRAIAERLARLRGDERGRRERIDYLRFQLAEIDDAGVALGEEETLRSERAVLRHAGAIQEALAGAVDDLYEREGAAHGALVHALGQLRGIAEWEPLATAWAGELDELQIRLGELEADLTRRLGEVASDPRRLDAVESRLATLERLFRKHGGTSAEVLARQAELGAELADLAGDAESHRQLEEQEREALGAYREAATKLSTARGKWGEALARGVRAELADLALGQARFAVRLGRRRRADSPLRVDGEAIDFGPAGFDQVSYVFSPNPGEELRPLAKVASGGELSRLYLAIQLAAGGAEASTTLVFDEVDSGIGGAEAAALGAKLHRLAASGQIVAVTHLPQVACHADVHFKVSKRVGDDDRTHTELAELDAEGRVAEVARMLAGSELTTTSLDHARELIAEAHAG